MQTYLRLSKSITMDKQVFKNNMDTIENIDVIKDLINTMIFGPMIFPYV